MISIDAAIEALQVGLREAEELREPSSLAIVDAGGNLVAFACADGVAFGTGDIAINKAFTAAAFRVKTADLMGDAVPGGELFGLVTAGSTRPYVVFGGGVPVSHGETCVGAVGVSGGPVSADVRIADAMAAFLGKAA